VLLNESALSFFDLAHSQPDAVVVSVARSAARFELFAERSPAAALRSFTEQRGRSLIAAPWTFGPWKQTSSTLDNITEVEIVSRMVDQNIPISCRQGYVSATRATSRATLSETQVHFFPDGSQVGHEKELAAQNLQFHTLGVKSTTYFNSCAWRAARAQREHVCPAQTCAPTTRRCSASSLPTAGLSATRRESPTSLRTTGETPRSPVVESAERLRPACTSDFLDPTRHFFVGEIDYTAPGAVEWYREQIISSVAMGFDGFMYDYGQATAAARACSAPRAARG
jgi:hypothetical protein